jgi:Ribbon-helix-helix protein, copG family
MHHVKRLQIMIDEDLDAELERIAHEQKTSKAALIRRFVRQSVEPGVPVAQDPLWQMVGADDYRPEAVDDVVYP